MIYAAGDVHGCFEEFMKLLDTIGFSEEDRMFLLGDVIDRGPEPVKLLRELSLRDNIYLILGNHEYMARQVLPKLLCPLEEETVDLLDDELLRDLKHWYGDGGEVTAAAFRALDPEDREFYLEYLEEAEPVQEVTVGEQTYILCHSLPETYTGRGDFGCTLPELLFGRPDFEGDWDQEEIFLIGHTPTRSIPGAEPDRVYRKNHLIDLDCGCVFGGRLACLCLDTGEITYVDHGEKASV